MSNIEFYRRYDGPAHARHPWISIESPEERKGTG
jgi:hypothetical protein